MASRSCRLHRDSKGWTRDLAARENRRITARTPMDIHGPARGHALMRTNADPGGTRVLGTFANCSAGKTPWGTYLTSEENVDDYFAGGAHGARNQQGCGDARRQSPLRAAREQLLWLGSPGSAFRYSRRAPRAVPVRLDGGDRPARSEIHSAQAHLARALSARRRKHHRRQERPRRGLHGRRREIRIHLQVRHARSLRCEESGRQSRPARPWHAVLRAVRRRRHGRMAAAGSRRKRPVEFPRRLREPGRRGHQGARRGGLVRRHAHGSARGRGAEPDHRTHLHPLHQDGGARRRRNEHEWSAARSTSAPNAANPRPDNKSGHIIEMAEAGDDATGTRFEWNVFLLAGDPADGPLHRRCARTGRR